MLIDRRIWKEQFSRKTQRNEKSIKEVALQKLNFENLERSQYLYCPVREGTNVLTFF